MIKKTAVLVTLIAIVSLSIAGCTSSNPNTDAPFTSPAQTMTPRPDFTSYYNSFQIYGADNSKSPYNLQFTRSTNTRGNDVYTNVSRDSKFLNAWAFELAKTKAEAQQIFNKTVAGKQKSGFTTDSDGINKMKTGEKNPIGLGASTSYADVWEGARGSQRFSITYQYNPRVSSWEINTQDIKNS
ncbi:MAG: hypothetical protein ACXV76_12850 [Halobacteriota archaeon]